MLLELKLVRRYHRRSRPTLLRFTSIVAILSIAAGVGALIVAQAVGRGFQAGIQAQVLANTPHISVFRTDGSRHQNWKILAVTLQTVPEVRSVEPVTIANAVVTSKNGASVAAVYVHGQSHGVEPAPVKIGAELAKTLELTTGDAAELTIVDQPSGPITASITIEGIVNTGFYEYDSSRVEIGSADFARISGDPEFYPTLLQLSVMNVSSADIVAASIRERLDGNYRVLDWKEANKPLFSALELERRAALAFISLLVIIAVLKIATTLALLVNERKLDIAVLRTIGARTRELVTIFLMEGLFLGLAGTAIGVVVALAICLAANRFDVLRVSPEVYMVGQITLMPTVWDVSLIATGALILSLCASAYPVFKASRIKPLENLRNQ